MTASVRSRGRFIVDVVSCPDCHCEADAVFGDHGGECVMPPAERLSGLEVIRRYALTHEVLSANELRPLLDRHGVPDNRGPIFGAAIKAGYIRKVGSVQSTGHRTKGHDLKAYISLLCPTNERNRSA